MPQRMTDQHERLHRLMVNVVVGIEQRADAKASAHVQVGAQRLDETKTVVDKLKVDLTRMQPTIEQGKKD
jgi:hypothetical protein